MMLKGFVLDQGHYQYKSQQVWVEGKPESSFWSGLKTSGKETFFVSALRCIGCGKLEFYAGEPADIDSIFS